MLKKYIIAAFAAAAVGTAAYGMTAFATTVDDVAEVARQYGYSEDMIQQGYNKYYQNPDAYSEADFEEAIAALHEAGSQVVTTGSYDPEAYTRTTTTTSAVSTTQSNETKPSSTQKTDSGNGQTTSAASSSTQAAPVDSDPDITLTTNDGSTFTRMGTKEFIALSYEEKMAYLRTFTPEQQQIIIDNLTPAEYRSLLKQAPADTKMNVISDLSQAAQSLDMNITINEISEDSVSVAMRDNNSGELLAVANAGAVVEETGYDRRGVLTLSAALILGAFAGLGILLRKCFRPKTGEENEQ